MYNSLSYKSKQFFWLIIKLSIVIGCGYFIYQKLTSNNHFKFSVFYQKLTETDFFSIKNISLLLIFTFLNHFLEILKWKKLASFCAKISLKHAVIQSLSSLTTSLITPNRIGEYGAKALYFEKKYRKKILALNFIGNLHQMLITMAWGCIGFSYFALHNTIAMNYHRFFKITLIILLVVVLFFVSTKYCKSIPFYLKKAQIFINKIPISLHLKVLFLSFLRFVIFSHQFYVLLLIFKVDISYLNAIFTITSVYFISSFIPILSLFALVLKGTVAIWGFSFYHIEPTLILIITTLMWILNFAFPAILGSYFVLTFKPKFAK